MLNVIQTISDSFEVVKLQVPGSVSVRPDVHWKPLEQPVDMANPLVQRTNDVCHRVCALVVLHISASVIVYGDVLVVCPNGA